MSRVSKDIWNKSKDGNKAQLRSFIRYFIISTAICVLILFLKRDNIIHMIGAEITVHKQNREMQYYRRQIDELDRRIGILSNDRDTLETLAREQYLFAEPGDDVFLTKER